jgi:hypothetical protein
LWLRVLIKYNNLKRNKEEIYLYKKNAVMIVDSSPSSKRGCITRELYNTKYNVVDESDLHFGVL